MPVCLELWLGCGPTVRQVCSDKEFLPWVKSEPCGKLFLKLDLLAQPMPPDFLGWGHCVSDIRGLMSEGSENPPLDFLGPSPNSCCSVPMLTSHPGLYTFSLKQLLLSLAWDPQSSPPVAYGLFCPPGCTCWCLESCKCTEFPSRAQLAFSDAP